SSARFGSCRMLSSSHTTCLPTSSTPAPSAPSVTSDPCRISMETYWREVRSIEEEEEEEGEDEAERKSMDEVELEEAWLAEAGLSSLVTEEDTPLSAEVLLSTLTRQQAATVRKRLDKYTETLKSRNRQPVKDHQPDEGLADRSPSSSSGCAESPPGPYHITTKTIRRSNHRVRPTIPTFLSQDPLGEDASPSQHTLLETHPRSSHTPTTPADDSRQADWLLREYPYSEGVAEHKQRGTCWDCLRFHGDNSDDHPRPQFGLVSPAQGLTWADDLSSHDLTSLGFICHIELSTFLQTLGVQTKRTRSRRLRTRGAFHVPPQGWKPQTHNRLNDSQKNSQSKTSRVRVVAIDFKKSHFTLNSAFKVMKNNNCECVCVCFSDSGVFNVPLNSLLENDRKKFPGIKVPVFFQKLLWVLESSLQTEGILRVPGSAARLKFLRREADRRCGGFDWSTVRPADAAGLLKLFIRELPTPLLTHTHLPTYRSVLGIPSVVHQVQALQLLILLLPEAHRETLRALLVFLRKVVSHQDQNRMSLWNVSMVMSPNLFSCLRPKNKSSAAKQQQEMEEAVGGAYLIRLMITHQDLLWTVNVITQTLRRCCLSTGDVTPAPVAQVPNFLLSQVRHMNQASSQKELVLSKTRRLLRKKNGKNDMNRVSERKREEPWQITDLCEGVIRVHAPLHTKVSMAIQLDGQMRAKDVTCRFECDNSPCQHLYEVGGNISKFFHVLRHRGGGVSGSYSLTRVSPSAERRLHPDCVLLEVYRVNPHCDWLIK
ncbi:unnamed protein product, partial [Tetraodon nigroviridis]